MDESSASFPNDLEERFLPPEGWRWHEFKNAQGRKLRFGTVAPPSRVPDAVVVVLQGLSEFTEKYFELAHNLLDQNLSFWMMDWQGQGGSERPLKNPHKRHSSGFDNDIADLHFFINEYVKHSAVHPDVGRIPLVMLGHSMGANIGMRYLFRPDTFACAAFSAPMVDIHALAPYPKFLATTATAVMNGIIGKGYVGFGNGDWKDGDRNVINGDIFSHDPVRKELHNLWMRHNEKLRLGHVTYGWVYQALHSCIEVQKKNVLRNIKTPSLIALAGQDKLVHNNAARKAAKLMEHVKILELEDSRHEILMETDAIRNRFLNAFFELLTVNKISEQRKPF